MSGVHDHAMGAWTSWLGRWCDRFADAFVTETVCDDGTRLLIALDPSMHLSSTTVVASGDTANVAGVTDPLPRSWDVPDDLAELLDR